MPAAELPRDDKDWTWVLVQPCPDCGFVAADVPVSTVPATLMATVPRWRAALARPDAATRTRADRWSVLEYGAHVRDVCRVFDERLRLILTHDDPQFDNWDQDATAVADDYAAQVPGRVADELAAGAHAFALHLQAVPADAWQRPGRRSNGSVFTVESLTRYFLHDVVHHLYDVGA